MRLIGTVKWFNDKKGYGFIEPDEKAPTDGLDVFAHYSAIDGHGYRNLREKDRVSFDLVDKGKGPLAQNIRVINNHGHLTASELAAKGAQ